MNRFVYPSGVLFQKSSGVGERSSESFTVLSIGLRAYSGGIGKLPLLSNCDNHTKDVC